MSKTKRTVLITGCSDGGSGAALAEAFHNAGLHVYATARNLKKMEHLASLGIELLELDVLSESSISACAGKVDSLDILVNNAGGQYVMPLADISISKAKSLFDLNVWSYIQVTQAFLPLLLKSDSGIIVNHTSAASVLSIPFQATYNASKAAIAMVTDTLRLEMQPFGIQVVDLRSGLINTNIINNANEGVLPEDSIYAPAREVFDKTLSGADFQGAGDDASSWAKAVAADVLKKSPPKHIWRGKTSWVAWLGTMMPLGTLDGLLSQAVGLDKVNKIMKK